MIIVAIDPGVKNGLAVYHTKTKSWDHLKECAIWEVFETLEALQEISDEVKIYIEDARKNWNPKEGRNGNIAQSNARAQGAGWIKTLSGVYEKYCIEHKMKYEMIKPSKHYTKKDNVFVKLQTGIETQKGKQNLRDAIMLLHCYGLH